MSIQKEKLNNYAAFVEKFEPKKTTDDCYTPKEVYDVIVDYVASKYPLEGKQILRPFMPNGDFEAVDYSPDSVVIDNPPFSIITRIAKFYISRNIPFFLFAPHLTLFSSDLDCTAIVVGGDITYENGAVVKTSFLTNMVGDFRVIGEPLLFKRLEEINTRNRVNLPKYVYPPNVLTVSMVAWMVDKGIGITIPKHATQHCRGLDSQKKHGKAIFGSGFLLSDSAAAEKAAAEKANVIEWELSSRERDIIENLNTSTP